MLKTLLLPNLYLSKEKKDTIQDSVVPSAHVQQKTPYFADTPDHGICIQQQAALNELIHNTYHSGFCEDDFDLFYPDIYNLGGHFFLYRTLLNSVRLRTTGHIFYAKNLIFWLRRPWDMSKKEGFFSDFAGHFSVFLLT